GEQGADRDRFHGRRFHSSSSATRALARAICRAWCGSQPAPRLSTTVCRSVSTSERTRNVRSSRSPIPDQCLASDCTNRCASTRSPPVGELSNWLPITGSPPQRVHTGPRVPCVGLLRYEFRLFRRPGLAGGGF